MSRAVVPVARRDLPSSTPSARGSLSKALMAARPEFRDESLNELHKNTYAATTTKSRDSRWKLWLQITNAWDLDALPLTVRSVDAVAASLRAGGYKTAKLLFSQARQEHVAQTHTPVPPEVILRMTQAERAVERGRGPSKLKDSFYVEDIARIDTTDREFPTPIQWTTRLSHRIDMVIICCCWLLRGIDSASVMLNFSMDGSHAFGPDGVYYSAVYQDGHRRVVRHEITPLQLSSIQSSVPFSCPTTTSYTDAIPWLPRRLSPIPWQ